jgi:hypothetical protein
VGRSTDAAAAARRHVARSRQARPAMGTVSEMRRDALRGRAPASSVELVETRWAALRDAPPRRSSLSRPGGSICGTRPRRRSSLSRPGGPLCGCRGSGTQARREVSTGSTSDGYRLRNASRRSAGRAPLAGRACRDPVGRSADAAAAARRHVARSRRARPALRTVSEMRRDALRDAPASSVELVETRWADLRDAPASSVERVETRWVDLRMPRQRHAGTSRGLDRLDQRSVTSQKCVATFCGSPPVVGRACRDPVGRSVDAAAAARRHGARSRRARPAMGDVSEMRRDDLRDAPASSVELVETRWAALRMPRQRHAGTSRGLDRLDQRSVTSQGYVATLPAVAPPPSSVELVETRWADLRDAPASSVELVETRGAALRMPRQRHAGTSRGLDGLDQRWVTSQKCVTTICGTRPPRRSSVSRPGGSICGCRGSGTQARREVSTGSTSDGCAGVVGRACRDPTGTVSGLRPHA